MNYQDNLTQFWDSIHNYEFIKIEQILEKYPEFLFDRTAHYMGYNVAMYASINDKKELYEILSKNYVNFIKALNSNDFMGNKLHEYYISNTLAYLVCL